MWVGSRCAHSLSLAGVSFYPLFPAGNHLGGCKILNILRWNLGTSIWEWGEFSNILLLSLFLGWTPLQNIYFVLRSFKQLSSCSQHRWVNTDNFTKDYKRYSQHDQTFTFRTFTFLISIATLRMLKVAAGLGRNVNTHCKRRYLAMVELIGGRWGCCNRAGSKCKHPKVALIGLGPDVNTQQLI